VSSGQTRTYQRAASVVFLKTNEAFGGLSNMAGGFPLRVNGVRILTSEALYQACRFPHLPDVQRLIIEQRSPMTAKMKSKPHRSNSRGDWFQVRVKIMRWCLRVKLAQNWRKFSELLLETGDRPIVEQSRKDDFWGAKPIDDDTLVGMNVLGRLLMELREAVKTETRETLCFVDPLAIPDFLLGGEPIGVVATRIAEIAREQEQAGVQVPRGHLDDPAVVQQSLFDEPVVKETPLAEQSAVRPNGVHVADLKPYAEYKESGLPWVGKMPVHWGSRRMKFLFKERTQKGFPNEPLLAATQSKGVVRKEDYGLRTVTAMNGLENLKLVDVGDFVISLRSFQGGIEVSHARGIISPAYTVLRPRDDFEPRYFKSYFKSDDFIRSLTLFVTGIREGQNIDYGRLSRAFMPLPPPDEQVAIVRFLDWANGRLERAIRAKRKTIALLNEQKQAIIHRAVTRGLDPSVPLKPSGIPWLTNFPNHWEFNRGKYYFRETDVRSSTGEEELLSVSHITGVTPRSQKNITMFKAESYVGSKICTQGQIAVNTMWAWMAAIGVSEYHGLISPSYHTYEQIDSATFSNDFLDLLLRSPLYKILYTVNSTGVTSSRLRLYPEDFLNIRFLCPPRHEQEAIVESVRDATADIKTSMIRMEREIELLAEFRTRLVSDVVTGKIDVREAAARLPDDAALESVEDAPALAEELETADEVAAL